MPAVTPVNPVPPSPAGIEPKRSAPVGWTAVVIAAVVMLATLPGRTQGLGLITEGMLRDLRLDRVAYADLNLWATLLGAVVCLPAGWLFDRLGLRWTTVLIVLLLGLVVSQMSAHTGSIGILFLLIMLTRALGQSALSVASITIVGKAAGSRVGLAMAVYSVLLSVFFAVAFGVIGSVVREQGWRAAWADIGLALILGVAPLVALFTRSFMSGKSIKNPARPEAPEGGLELMAALRTPAFWVFGGAASLYGLVASGLGLFNQSVFAERGFDMKTYHTFLAVTTLIALVGQLLCGWLNLRWSMQRLLAMAMFLYASGLAVLPLLKTLAQFWVFASLVGISGGIITVVFFAIWSHAFGKAHLGRIQGAAQMLTVLASAVGPLIFAQCLATFHSYAPALWSLALGVVLLGLAAIKVRLPKHSGPQSA